MLCIYVKYLSSVPDQPFRPDKRGGRPPVVGSAAAGSRQGSRRQGGDALQGIAMAIPGGRAAEDAEQVGVTAMRAVASDGGAETSAVSAARSMADRMSSLPSKERGGVSEAVVLPNGTAIMSGSKRGAAPSLNKTIDDMLATVPVNERGAGHGRCGLPQCLSTALDLGLDPYGGSAAGATVRGDTGNPNHGLPVEPCDSCQVLVDAFNLNWMRG
jgi:hypothetical protein